MNVEVIVQGAEERGYRGQVTALPGCASRCETIDDLMRNIREAIEGCLTSDVGVIGNGERVLDIALCSNGAAIRAAESSDLSHHPPFQTQATICDVELRAPFFSRLASFGVQSNQQFVRDWD